MRETSSCLVRCEPAKEEYEELKWTCRQPRPAQLFAGAVISRDFGVTHAHSLGRVANGRVSLQQPEAGA